jgi:hypothetical protein
MTDKTYPTVGDLPTNKYPLGTLIEGVRVCDTCGENVHMYQLDLDWFIWYVCRPCYVSFLADWRE